MLPLARAYRLSECRIIFAVILAHRCVTFSYQTILGVALVGAARHAAAHRVHPDGTSRLAPQDAPAALARSHALLRGVAEESLPLVGDDSAVADAPRQRHARSRDVGPQALLRGVFANGSHTDVCL